MSVDPDAAKHQGSEGTLLQPVPLKEDGVGEISAERRIDTPDPIRAFQRGLYLARMACMERCIGRTS